jgi:predicted GIY-YIG superfamily endonuclease
MKYPENERISKWEIYALVDPLDGNTKYIGMSKNAKRRFKQHLRLLDGNKCKNTWIDYLRGYGFLPELRIIEVVHDIITAKERETYWIQHYGECLTNLPNIVEQRRKEVSA